MLNRVLLRQYESSDMNKISHFSRFCLIQHSERWGSNKPYDLSYEHYASLFHPLEINSLYFSNRNATCSASSANRRPYAFSTAASGLRCAATSSGVMESGSYSSARELKGTKEAMHINYVINYLNENMSMQC